MDKFDVEIVNNWSDQYILNNKKEIICWLKDSNWPVASPVAKRIINHYTDFQDEILEVLKGGDIEWKMNVISGVLYEIVDIPKDILIELERIRNDPKEHIDVREEAEDIFNR